MLFANITHERKKPKPRPKPKPVAGPKKPLFVEIQKAVDDPNVGHILLCMTVKANCVDVSKNKDHCEMIEIISQAVDIERRHVMSNVFHSYVLPETEVNGEAMEKHLIRPVIKLFEDFLAKLSNKKIYKIDNAEKFSIVLKTFEQWLTDNRITQNKCLTVVEHLDDFNMISQLQFKKSAIALHWAFKSSIDIRVEFVDFYKVFEPIEDHDVFRMCEKMYMKSEGELNDGLDGVFNLAMIVAQMLRDGVTFQKDKKYIN